VTSPRSTGNESGKAKTKVGCILLSREFGRDVRCSHNMHGSAKIFVSLPSRILKRHNITHGFVDSFAYRFQAEFEGRDSSLKERRRHFHNIPHVLRINPYIATRVFEMKTGGCIVLEGKILIKRNIHLLLLYDSS
jgi:hypothetical protein